VQKRISSGLAANTLGKVWVIVTQIITIPVLLSEWGASGYGVWLMLTAIPTYVALSDFGFGTAAGVEMIRKVSQHDLDGALETFQSVWLLITAFLGIVSFIALLAWIFQDTLLAIFGIPPMDKTISNAAMLLVIYAIAAIEMSILNLGFRSAGRYAQGTILYDLLMPMEVAIVIVMAWHGENFSSCAGAMAIMRVVGYFSYYAILRRHEPWLQIGWMHASWKELRKLAHPAFAAFTMPLATALSMQGVIFAIGVAMSPALAGVFGAVRTVTRVPMQMAAIVTRATLPEMTRAYSMENAALSERLVALNFLALTAFVIPFLLFAPFGNGLIMLISHDNVRVSAAFFIIMSGMAAIQAGWNTVAMFLFAENKQQKFTYWAAILAFVAAMVPFIIGAHVNPTVLAAMLAFLDLALFIIVGTVWRRETSIKFSRIISDMVYETSQIKLFVFSRLRN
jgi:O-antigen/teichoic acid export membrane protein